MRPAAEKLLQHRFMVRPHPNAKMEFLPLIAASKDFMAATMARMTSTNVQGTLRNAQPYTGTVKREPSGYGQASDHVRWGSRVSSDFSGYVFVHI